MRVRVIGVLYSCSWAAEKLFKQRGHFQTFIWCTESQDGARRSFETSCEVERVDVSDADALRALADEMRMDFERDDIAAFAVAFPASMMQQLAPSVLHLEAKRVRHEVIALEAHDGDIHLRAHREILSGHPSRLAALSAIEQAGDCRFGGLLAA